MGARGPGGPPARIFVNKLDRERADFQATLDQLVSSFGNQVAPFELPIGAEHEFHRRPPPREGRPLPLGTDRRGVRVARREPSRWRTRRARSLIEAVAESDDA